MDQHNKAFDDLAKSLKDGKLPRVANFQAVHTISTERKDGNEAEILLELQRLKEWLESKILELETVLEYYNIPVSSRDTDVTERIIELEKVLLETTITSSLKSLTLERMQCSDALVNTLFTATKTPTEEKNKQMHLELVEEQNRLVIEILDHQKEVEKAQEDLDNVRQKAIEVKRANRELMNELQERNSELEKKRNRRKSRREKLLDEDLNNLSSKLIITRHVLQALILASGVNWAKDPNLQELLISLGRKIDFYDQD